MTNPYESPAKELPGRAPSPKAKAERNHLSDFVAAGFLFSLIMGGFAYLAFTQTGTPDLGGYPRSLALGVPTAALSAAFFLAGLWVVLSRSKAAVYSVCAVTFLMLFAEVCFELSTTGTLFAFKLISFVFYAIPFVLLRSLRPAMRQIDAEGAAQTKV